MTRRIAPLAFALIALPFAAFAQERMAPVTDPATLSDCTECHMAFPAGFMPARSWVTIMEGLKTHFGENATITEENRISITAYLVDNAADSGAVSSRTASRILNGIDANVAPARISEMPWWTREHEHEVSQAEWDSAKSPANCVACHFDAERGFFGD